MNEEEKNEIFKNIIDEIYSCYEAEISLQNVSYNHPMFYNGTFSENNTYQPPKPKELMTKEKPREIDYDEWLYKGCFIQKSEHPELIGKYEVFKNDKPQSHVGRCFTFTEAKKLCEENECFENALDF